jgi:hypothetical protein
MQIPTASRLLCCLAVLAAASGCAAPEQTGEITSIRFGSGARPQGVARSNVQLAEDFADLTFGLENGETLDSLLRYETPIRVHVRSRALEPYRRDLEELLARLRREAGIDIAETGDSAAAQIFIEVVPADDISRFFPNAACFIVPGTTSWRDFMRGGPANRMRWSDQETLTHAVIFLPLDTTPQDVRDCLSEEITQALGPANDLYRLPDSIWNDDNFHGAATPFDMLILRTLYQPEIHSGMSRDVALAQASRVLDRVNPQGRGLAATPRYPESRQWDRAIETALSRRLTRAERLRGAQMATDIATGMQPADHRLAVSLLTLGRLRLRTDPGAAAEDFTRAYTLLQMRYGADDLRTAQAAVHVAALALGTGQYDLAVDLVDRHMPSAVEGQNAILAAGLMSVKAEALVETGDLPGARTARVESLRWARYGFGDTDGSLAREQAELAAIARLEEGVDRRTGRP